MAAIDAALATRQRLRWACRTAGGTPERLTQAQPSLPLPRAIVIEIRRKLAASENSRRRKRNTAEVPDNTTAECGRGTGERRK